MTSTREHTRQTAPPTEKLEGLTPERRYILAVVQECSPPVEERTLATELAAERTAGAPKDIDGLQTRLHHVDLPKLAAGGYITWTPSDGTVTALTLPMGPETRLEVIGERTPKQETEGSEPIQNERRETVLSLIETLHGPQSGADLAHGVAAIEGATDPTAERVRAVERDLHHVHLPKLAEAGLIRHSPADRTATAVDPR